MSARVWPVTAPLAERLSDAAAIEAASGMSTMQTTSYWPKAKYIASSLPPTDSTEARAASRRFVPPSFSTPLAPSAVYETSSRYFGMSCSFVRFGALRRVAHPFTGVEKPAAHSRLGGLLRSRNEQRRQHAAREHQENGRQNIQVEVV